ncbi:MAG: GNAT family N-acetyltransferase [Pseudomonadota bacterium]
MPNDTAIDYSETDTKGRYSLSMAGGSEEAEMTFSKASSSLIIVDHTYVPDHMRGQGVADQLAQRLIEDARKKGQKIMPLCPFLNGYMARHRDTLKNVLQ